MAIRVVLSGVIKTSEVINIGMRTWRHDGAGGLGEPFLVALT